MNGGLRDGGRCLNLAEIFDRNRRHVFLGLRHTDADTCHSACRLVCGGDVDGDHFHQSDFEGVAEETCLFVWFDTESVTQETRRKLAYVASAYRQYSIAITSGNTVFIKGA